MRIVLVVWTDYESSKGVKVHACNLSTWEVEARVQGQPQLCGKYKVSLGYMTLSQNKTKKNHEIKDCSIKRLGNNQCIYKLSKF